MDGMVCWGFSIFHTAGEKLLLLSFFASVATKFQNADNAAITQTFRRAGLSRAQTLPELLHHVSGVSIVLVLVV